MRREPVDPCRRRGAPCRGAVLWHGLEDRRLGKNPADCFAIIWYAEFGALVGVVRFRQQL